MGWMVAAAAVFVILASLVTRSLCMAARDEDDDAEQMKWIQDIEEKHRKRKDGGSYTNAQFPPMDLCIRSIPYIYCDIR